MLTNEIVVLNKTTLENFRRFINYDNKIAPTSAELYGYCLSKFGRWLGETGRTWGGVDKRIVVEYIDELKAQGLKNSSINSVMKSLKRSYKAAIDAGAAVENPLDGLSYLRESRSTKKRWLNESEARRVLRSIEGREGEVGARDFAVVSLLLFSGLRASEAANLRWSDIEDGTINVKRGKGGLERSLELHPKAAAALERYAVYHRGEYILNTVPTARFLERNKMTRHSIYGVMVRVGRRLGMRLHPHQMRHSYASCALENGANVVALAGAMGHADVSMVLNVYSHTDSRVAEFITF